MIRKLAVCVLAASTLLISAATTLRAAPPKLNWEKANAQRMFVLTNDGKGIAAIVVDTTQPEHLRVAIRLQELIQRLGKARLPIVDREYARIPWRKIHLTWDRYPMTFPKYRFVIEMKENDPTSYNPAKQIIVAGSSPATLDEAVSAFTVAAFGVPLKALDEKELEWQAADTLAIPEDFKTIRADWAKQKTDK